MWNIERTRNILDWIKSLDLDSNEAILKHILILQEFGPSLGRPYVDSVRESKHKNMKELRVQVKRKVLRILFAFGPERSAILLIGGDKRGNKQFYKKFIPLADKLFDEHLKKLGDLREKAR